MFFDNFCFLCNQKGVSPNKIAKELSISSGSVTEWKRGRTPRMPTLIKIADYFGVSTDYLLNGAADVTDFSPQTKKLAELIRQLDERDQIKLEGIIEEMLRADKYQKSASQGA